MRLSRFLTHAPPFWQMTWIFMNLPSQPSSKQFPSCHPGISRYKRESRRIASLHVPQDASKRMADPRIALSSFAYPWECGKICALLGGFLFRPIRIEPSMFRVVSIVSRVSLLLATKGLIVGRAIKPRFSGPFSS